MNWSEEQLSIIKFRPDARLLVDAGPGTGKTAVLGARIAHVVEALGDETASIWVVSFTRTAVAELRQRLGSYVEDKSKLSRIRIFTLDSGAWSINSGFNFDSSLGSGFTRNIKDVISLIAQHEGVFEYLKTIDHLFVDEAQDIVGIRAELVMEMLNVLPPTAGLTVFSDDAQAIYGSWSEDGAGSIGGTLPENIRKYFGGEYAQRVLSQNFRTSDERLMDLYSICRSIVLSDVKGESKYRGVRNAITDYAKASNQSVFPPVDSSGASTLVIGRTRLAALNETFARRKAPFQWRMTGTPSLVQPWVGALLWDYKEKFLDFEDFRTVWAKRIPTSSMWDPEIAWTTLLANFEADGRSGKIDLAALSSSIAGMFPPSEICCLNYGFDGPILGTIHTSKGREADNVLLRLPKWPKRGMPDAYYAEEARVLLVGATRARLRLDVVETNEATGRSNVGAGRTYLEVGERLRDVHIEIGKNGDIVPTGMAGVEFMKTSQAADAQDLLTRMMNTHTLGELSFERNDLSGHYQWCLRCDSHPDQRLAYLSKNFLWELKSLPREYGYKGHSLKISNVSILGARTMAVAPDDSLRKELLSPFNVTGIFLAPVVGAFPLLGLKASPTVTL